jgi:hypothetical protein
MRKNIEDLRRERDELKKEFNIANKICFKPLSNSGQLFYGDGIANEREQLEYEINHYLEVVVKCK